MAAASEIASRFSQLRAGAIKMERLGEREKSRFRYRSKVHTYRTLTAALAWALLVAAFYQTPDLLTSAQRLTQQGIEAIGGSVPSPWRYGWTGFREMGGVIWLQITMIILTLRILLSTIAAAWRVISRKTGPSKYERMSDPVALAVYGALTLAFVALLFFILLSV